MKAEVQSQKKRILLLEDEQGVSGKRKERKEERLVTEP